MYFLKKQCIHKWVLRDHTVFIVNNASLRCASVSLLTLLSSINVMHESERNPLIRDGIKKSFLGLFLKLEMRKVVGADKTQMLLIAYLLPEKAQALKQNKANITEVSRTKK